MELSPKQREYIENSTHRFNIKSGATRSGKSFLDIAYTIPSNIRRLSGKDGLFVILGNTKGTIQRNVIEPMQELFGIKYVSDIKADNTAKIFGERVYCLGASKITQVDVLRGASIKFCYGDEICTFHPDVFQMLKTRLDKKYSTFHGACNPEHPEHYVKKFLDSDADIYHQHYQIYDNPFLDEFYVKNLEKELEGTVYFNRYILGQWTRAEGIIFAKFADNATKFYTTEKPNNINLINIGVDFGGNNSKTTFVATAIHDNYTKITVLKDYKMLGEKGEIVPSKIYEELTQFTYEVVKQFGEVSYIFCDSAEQYLINGVRTHFNNVGLRVGVLDSAKGIITDRIKCLLSLMNTDSFKIFPTCENVINSLKTQLWSDKKDDTRLDDGTCDIDTADALEYSFSKFLKYLTPKGVNNGF